MRSGQRVFTVEGQMIQGFEYLHSDLRLIVAHHAVFDWTLCSVRVIQTLQRQSILSCAHIAALRKA